MTRLTFTLLAIAALIFTAAAITLMLTAPDTAGPPALLCALIALTCVLRIWTLWRR